ncbi:uncharacterized protein LOC131945998 isoform X2 [Physella acuta]|uniref:uncharacterized protein LOC131945998 isoform X2 n=1 Tax=Physella acuta TaxID=109671 RepID=UPI0027DB11AA|nr:uncharacterized protein LOC131945998 isoform X2 [Physella acuta]
MEKMFKFVLLICLGFLPDGVLAIDSVVLSIDGYEKECEQPECKYTGFIIGSFEDRAVGEQGRCTYVTLSQCESGTDCQQDDQWQEVCAPFAYPCQMSACGNMERNYPQCYCSSEHPVKIWFSPTKEQLEKNLTYRLGARVLENGEQVSAGFSKAIDYAEKPEGFVPIVSLGPEYSRRKFHNGSNQLRFDLTLVSAGVLLAVYRAKQIFS